MILSWGPRVGSCARVCRGTPGFGFRQAIVVRERTQLGHGGVGANPRGFFVDVPACELRVRE